MKDQFKTKHSLIQELSSLRQKIEELKQSEAQWKKEKEELKMKESRFRSCFDLPLHGIAITSLEKGWIEVNDRLCSIMGYSRDEIVRLTWSEMTHPDDLAADLEQFNRILSGQIEHYNLDKRFIRKDGKVVWTSLSVGCVRKHNGSVDQIIAMVEDVTSVKLAEEVLRKSEERFRLLADNSTDVIWAMTLDGNFTYISPSVTKLSGYTPQEVMEIPFHKYVVEAFVEPLMAEIAAQLQKPPSERLQTFQREIQQYCKDGTIKDIEITAGWLSDDQGDPIGIQGSTRDITSRKKAEEALIKSEEKFRKAFYSSPDSVNINRLEDGMYISINQGFTKIMGYTEEDIIGKTSIDCNIWENIEDRQRLVDGLRKGGKVTNLEAVFRTKSGDIRYGLMSASVIDLNGVPHILSITRDITDRKRVEQALKESESKYRLLADNVNDVIFVLDMNLYYTYVSPSVKILRGYEPEEVLNQPSIETVTSSSWDLAMKVVDEVMELEKAGDKEKIPLSRMIELEMKRKDGTTVWTEVKLSFIRDESQRPVGILGVTRDITERRQIEEALRDSEKKYRELYDFLPIPVYEMDFEFNITSANRAVYETFGGTKEDLINGFKAMQLLSPEEIEKSRKNMQRLLNGEQIGGTEYTLMMLDGSVFPAIIISSVIYINGKPVGLRGAIVDISERKRTEEELRRTLESLRKAIDTTIQVMVSVVEARDPYTAGHQLRVADLARAIAEEMGFSQNRIDGIRMAGTVHDLGKLSVPAEILSKPTELTKNEFSLIKDHSQNGYEILKSVESPWPLAEIAYQHHERMDGSGYPRNLRGEDILMEARIMAVADVVESMASHRPYRPAMGLTAALEEIENNRGTLYDKTVADACLRLFRERGYMLPVT